MTKEQICKIVTEAGKATTKSTGDNTGGGCGNCDRKNEPLVYQGHNIKRKAITYC